MGERGERRRKNKKTGAERTEKGNIKRMKESRIHSVLSVTLKDRNCWSSCSIISIRCIEKITLQQRSFVQNVKLIVLKQFTSTVIVVGNCIIDNDIFFFGFFENALVEVLATLTFHRGCQVNFESHKPRTLRATVFGVQGGPL